MVATDLTKGYPGNYSYITPDEAAAGLIARMDELTLETSGGFCHANGGKLVWEGFRLCLDELDRTNKQENLQSYEVGGGQYDQGLSSIFPRGRFRASVLT